MKSVLVLFTLLALLCGPANAIGKTKPNILILVADDMGYADSGVYNCKDIPTPNIDTIARNGDGAHGKKAGGKKPANHGWPAISRALVIGWGFQCVGI